VVLEDAVAGVDVPPGSAARALQNFAIQAFISFHPAICYRSNGTRLKFLTGGVW